MTQHTPGRIYKCDDRNVMGMPDLCPLHATAPMLLEALEEYVNESGYVGWDEVVFIRKARAAIRAAKGESNG